MNQRNPLPAPADPILEHLKSLHAELAGDYEVTDRPMARA